MTDKFLDRPVSVEYCLPVYAFVSVCTYCAKVYVTRFRKISLNVTLNYCGISKRVTEFSKYFTLFSGN